MDGLWPSILIMKKIMKKGAALMRIIDLTHIMTPDMPVYPGMEQPKLCAASTYAQDGFRETLLTMYSHTGTHMDAPAHIFPGLAELDVFPASQFVGKGLVIDCGGLQAGEQIGLEKISAVQALADEADFLLFYTGWDAYWRQPSYMQGFPSVSLSVAQYAVDTGKRGVGVDTISVDGIQDADLPVHRLLLGTNAMVIIENLTNLGKLGEGLFDFFALPLKFQASDGAPVRAIGLLQ